VNFGPLTANFNGFCALALLLHRRRSPEANQTLHDVWPSPELVHYRHILGAVAPDGILPGAKFTLRKSCVLLQARTPEVDVSQTLQRGTRNEIREL